MYRLCIYIFIYVFIDYVIHNMLYVKYSVLWFIQYRYDVQKYCMNSKNNNARRT